MPADFDKCVVDGGKVRTINVGKKGNQYMHVCYINGESHAGEVKTKQSKTKKKGIDMGKINAEEFAGIIKKSLDGIADTVVKSLSDENDTEVKGKKKDEKDPDVKKSVVVNFDTDKIVKGIVDGVGKLFEGEEDEMDEAEEFQKSVNDAKTKKELKAIRDKYEIPMKIKGEIKDIKKSLREKYFDMEKDEEDTVDEKTEKGKNKKGEDEDDKKINVFNDEVKKALKKAGLDEKDVEMNISVKGKKKSLVMNDTEDEEELFEEGVEDFDENDEEDVVKNFNNLSEKDKEDVARKGFGEFFKVKKS